MKLFLFKKEDHVYMVITFDFCQILSFVRYL